MIDVNENEGLRFYLHKYFVGNHLYYYQKEMLKTPQIEETIENIVH